MTPSANVLATTTLIDYRSALCTFTANASEALGMLHMDIRRAKDWLEEQKGQWAAAVRQAEDQFFQAKSELTRRRMMRIGDRAPDCSEQEEAFDRARHRLEFAQDKVAKCRKWHRALPEALIDFDGPANQLAGILEGEMPRMLAYLERKIASLEAYVQ